MARGTRARDDEPAEVKAEKKTAVVVVHGMGEQRPMDTLWGLVKALWTCDPDITDARDDRVYPKPDPIIGSFELRRITTRRVSLEPGFSKRADFFEFYWAHLMTGNTIGGFTAWATGLLIRKPSTVPAELRFPWIVGLAVLAFVTILIALAGAREWAPGLIKAMGLPAIPSWVFVAAAIATSVLGAVAARWLVPVAGDAARYLSATPDNVEARQKIREAGVDLITKLTDSGAYDRIVLVCHSLGCVVGYDILNHAWGRHDALDLMSRHAETSPAFAALNALERAAGELRHASLAELGAKRVVYRAAQRAYLAELAKPTATAGAAWLVSDFVTLGCPLSKAHVLLAHDAKEFEHIKARREAPACPPWLEKDDFKNRRFRFSYPLRDGEPRIPHHAAVFAPVVWTNVYFDNFLIVFGDIVSGPVARLFGRGVLDVRLRTGGPVFRHLDYWKDPTANPPPPWLRALRRAVNLKRLDDTHVWGAQATAAEIEAADLPMRQPPPPPRTPPAAAPAPKAPPAKAPPGAGSATRP